MQMVDNSWYIKIFTFRQIREAYNWILQSSRHVALHENPYTIRFGYHVMAKDMDNLREFGKIYRCPDYLLSRIGNHGTREYNGMIIYHYDDWRKGVKEIYQGIKN